MTQHFTNPARMTNPEMHQLSQRVALLEEQMEILQHVIKSYVNPGDISRAEVEVKVKNATKNKISFPPDNYSSENSDNFMDGLGQQQTIKTEPQEEQPDVPEINDSVDKGFDTGQDSGSDCAASYLNSGVDQSYGNGSCADLSMDQSSTSLVNSTVFPTSSTQNDAQDLMGERSRVSENDLSESELPKCDNVPKLTEEEETKTIVNESDPEKGHIDQPYTNDNSIIGSNVVESQGMIEKQNDADDNMKDIVDAVDCSNQMQDAEHIGMVNTRVVNEDKSIEVPQSMPCDTQEMDIPDKHYPEAPKNDPPQNVVDERTQLTIETNQSIEDQHIPEVNLENNQNVIHDTIPRALVGETVENTSEHGDFSYGSSVRAQNFEAENNDKNFEKSDTIINQPETVEPPIFDPPNTIKYGYSEFSFGDAPTNPNGNLHDNTIMNCQDNDLPPQQMTIHDQPNIETAAGDKIGGLETEKTLAMTNIHPSFSGSGDEYSTENNPPIEAGLALVPVGNFQNYGSQNAASFHSKMGTADSSLINMDVTMQQDSHTITNTIPDGYHTETIPKQPLEEQYNSTSLHQSVDHERSLALMPLAKIQNLEVQNIPDKFNDNSNNYNTSHSMLQLPKFEPIGPDEVKMLSKRRSANNTLEIPSIDNQVEPRITDNAPIETIPQPLTSVNIQESCVQPSSDIQGVDKFSRLEPPSAPQVQNESDASTTNTALAVPYIDNQSPYGQNISFQDKFSRLEPPAAQVQNENDMPSTNTAMTVPYIDNKSAYGQNTSFHDKFSRLGPPSSQVQNENDMSATNTAMAAPYIDNKAPYGQNASFQPNDMPPFSSQMNDGQDMLQMHKKHQDAIDSHIKQSQDNNKDKTQCPDCNYNATSKILLFLHIKRTHGKNGSKPSMSQSRSQDILQESKVFRKQEDGNFFKSNAVTRYEREAERHHMSRSGYNDMGTNKPNLDMPYSTNKYDRDNYGHGGFPGNMENQMMSGQGQTRNSSFKNFLTTSCQPSPGGMKRKLDDFPPTNNAFNDFNNNGSRYGQKQFHQEPYQDNRYPQQSSSQQQAHANYDVPNRYETPMRVNMREAKNASNVHFPGKQKKDQKGASQEFQDYLRRGPSNSPAREIDPMQRGQQQSYQNNKMEPIPLNPPMRPNRYDDKFEKDTGKSHLVSFLEKTYRNKNNNNGENSLDRFAENNFDKPHSSFQENPPPPLQGSNSSYYNEAPYMDSYQNQPIREGFDDSSRFMKKIRGRDITIGYVAKPGTGQNQDMSRRMDSSNPVGYPTNMAPEGSERIRPSYYQNQQF